MKRYSTVMLAGLIAAASGSVFAQSSTTDQPKAIGVSQETANKAHAKAMKKGDTATVVRTGPTAGDKAKDVASDAKAKASDVAGDAKDTATTAKDKAKAKVQ